MPSPRIAALIYGNQQHYLDHLAPLASMLGIPLILTDFDLETLAVKFYPELTLLYLPPASMTATVVSRFDVILSCLPKALFDSLFFMTEALHQKALINVWCPHGHSDKGHASYFMEGLAKERWACVYGNRMVDFLKEKGVYAQLEKIFFLGNYRLSYFRSHAHDYHQIMQEHLPLDWSLPTLLYAPTWEDGEGSSSFKGALPHLLNHVPDHWNLIIKPHPHLPFPLECAKKNILLLKDFPPIYPLLERVDAYLGDMSSIGYDFLTFKRPLLIYNPKKRSALHDKGLHLTKCGRIIGIEENPFLHIKKREDNCFIKMQTEVYDEVFDKCPTFYEIHQFFKKGP